MYNPSGGTVIQTSGATGSVESNNTCGTGAVNSCAGNVTTNPLFASGTPSSPADYKIQSGSYAIGTGTSVPVWADFLFANDLSPRDIGAMNH